MAKTQQTSTSRAPEGLEDLTAMTRQSFERLSGVFSGWLHDTNRLQAEAMRFFNERVNKDMAMLSQLAACKKPEEVFELQVKLASGLFSDYMAEGTRFLELYGEVAKRELDEFSNVLSTRH